MNIDICTECENEKPIANKTNQLCWACYSKGRRAGKWKVRYSDTSAILEETDRAWMAGFFDGEGSISLKVIASPKVTVQVYIQITNSLKAPLEPYHKYFGGNIIRYERKNPKELPMYRWTIQSIKRCSAFIDSLYPFMVAKKDVAKLALQALEIQKSRRPKKGNGYSEDDIKTFFSIKEKIIRTNKCS